MFWTKCHAVRCTVDTFYSQVGSNVLIYICFMLMKDDTPLILKEKKKAASFSAVTLFSFAWCCFSTDFASAFY